MVAALVTGSLVSRLSLTRGRKVTRMLPARPGKRAVMSIWSGGGEAMSWLSVRGGNTVASLDARHVEAPAAFLEEGAHAVRQIVWHAGAAVFQGIQAAVDSLEVSEAGQQLRLPTGWSVARRANKASRAGADPLDGLGAETDLFDVHSWGKVLWHGSTS